MDAKWNDALCSPAPSPFPLSSNQLKCCWRLVGGSGVMRAAACLPASALASLARYDEHARWKTIHKPPPRPPRYQGGQAQHFMRAMYQFRFFFSIHPAPEECQKDRPKSSVQEHTPRSSDEVGRQQVLSRAIDVQHVAAQQGRRVPGRVPQNYYVQRPITA